VAESSWPSPSNSRVVDDPSYEKLALSYGPVAGVVGGFTSPQLVYGDSSGMQIKVAADRYALVRGHEWYSGSTIFTKPIGSNSSGSTRTDLVVLRLSRTTWDVTVVVIAGIPGSGAPSPTQNVGTTGSFDLPLATVTVTNGAATISAANVNYIAAHLRGDGGGYQVTQFASLAYVPVPQLGQQAILSTTGVIFYYAGTGWAALFVPMTSFTPVFTSTSGTVNMGTAGILDGRYTQIGRQVHYSVYGWFGNSFSVGTGTWALTLPVAATAANSGSDGMSVGSAYLRDVSAGSSGHYQGVCVINPVLSASVMNPFSGNSQISPSNPFLWAAGDSFVLTINYEAA
jgi:hypothetical protein